MYIVKAVTLVIILTVYFFSPSNVFASSDPVIAPIFDNGTVEGETYTDNGSFTDYDPGSCTATVDYGDGTGVQSLALDGDEFTLNHVYPDDGWYTTTVTVTDSANVSDTETATIYVSNLTPEIDSFTVSATPSAVSAVTNLSATFIDPGVLDTHTAVWDFGDGATSSGTITESNGSGSITGSHTYAAAGVYEIMLTLLDNSETGPIIVYRYVTKYTAANRFLGGSVSFEALPGSFVSNPTQSATMTFGVQAHQSILPLIPLSGSLVLSERHTNFYSNNFTLFTAVGSLGQIQGTGEYNGAPGYNVSVTATDGQKLLGGGLDKIRIRITDPSNNVVFDNQLGEGSGITGSPLTSGGIILP